MENKNYKVITPAGPIYVRYASEAQEYNKNYGYPYVKLTPPQRTKTMKEEEQFIECGVCWGGGEIDINEDMETVVCWMCNGSGKLKVSE